MTIGRHIEHHITEVRVRVSEVRTRHAEEVSARLRLRHEAITREGECTLLVVELVVAGPCITAYRMRGSIVIHTQGISCDRHDNINRCDHQAILHHRHIHGREVRVHVLEIGFTERHTVRAHIGTHRHAIVLRADELQVVSHEQVIVACEVIAAHAMLLAVIYHGQTMLRDCHVRCDRSDLQAILHNRDDHVVEVRVRIHEIILLEEHAVLADLSTNGHRIDSPAHIQQILPFVQNIIARKVVAAHAMFLAIVCLGQTMLRDCHVHGDWSNLQAVFHDRYDNIAEVRVHILEIILREGHTVLADLRACCDGVAHSTCEFQVASHEQIIVAREVVTAHAMLQTVVCLGQTMLRDRHMYRHWCDLQTILHNRDDHIAEVRVQVLEIILRECHAVLANLDALRRTIG